ncbi:hypothetical protein E3U55_14965 [Filobacillus milosensis]|uniref:Uncharacterized protein n=1 Tax=Filobacillus milosensis TaxID=94137 RepID=A0A4Y8IDL7_9BACI|nr:hypothetical protein [Filobacillus milosensis]TFB14078.1 hypothetical protein E3U55_14965 [Filobacillus milosensis]
MEAKKKAIIAGIIGLCLFGAIIFYLSYLGLKTDPDQVKEVKKEAKLYLEEKYNEPYEIVDTMYDNVDVYEQFNYAAITSFEERNDPFKFLVFKHADSGEYMDSYVAETWEYELKSFLTPLLNETYGEDHIQELWMTYPKDIGHQLGIDSTNIPSLKDYDASPIIRITLNRGKEENDEDKLEDIIKQMEQELNINSGHITLSFSDSAIIFKDKDIRKDF